MTPAEIASALRAAGYRVAGFADVGGLVRLTLHTPAGLEMAVEVPILAGLVPTLANAETVIRYATTQFGGRA